MDFMSILQLLDSSLRLATPLLLACLAGLFSERAGIFDIGLEGKMLASAFAAGAVAAVSGSAWIGLAAGIGASMVLAAIHGLASITLKGNQLISGVAINFLASGMTALIGQNWFSMGGQTPQLTGDSRFLSISLPGVDALSGIPVLGPIYSELISGHNILVYIALLTVPLTWWKNLMAWACHSAWSASMLSQAGAQSDGPTWRKLCVKQATLPPFSSPLKNTSAITARPMYLIRT